MLLNTSWKTTFLLAQQPDGNVLMLSISETNNLLHPLLKMVSIYQKLYLICFFYSYILS
jgi:hypothetical protein